MVVCCRAQNSRVVGQITLCQGGHDAAARRCEDLQANFVADGDRMTDSLVLDETRFSLSRLHDDIRPESPFIEAAGRIMLL